MYNIRHEIAEYLKTHFIDCLILTEAYQDNNDNLSLFKEFNFNGSFHPETKRGIIILTKKTFEIRQIDIVESGHIIGMKLRERSFNFSMVGIYNKTAGHDNVSFKVLNSLYKYLNYHNNALICLGDFNVNLLSTSKSKLHDIIYKIIREYDLTDIGNIFGNSPTWRGKGNRAKSISRLDLVLTNLTRKKYNFTLLPTTSDHDLLLFKYYLGHPTEKYAIICKDFILNNDKFINEVITIINDLSMKIIPLLIL